MKITKLEWRTVSVDESKKDRIRIETRSAEVAGGAIVHVMSERRDSRNHQLIVNESIGFVPAGVSEEAGKASPSKGPSKQTDSEEAPQEVAQGPDADIDVETAKAPAKKAPAKKAASKKGGK